MYTTWHKERRARPPAFYRNFKREAMCSGGGSFVPLRISGPSHPNKRHLHVLIVRGAMCPRAIPFELHTDNGPAQGPETETEDETHPGNLPE